MRHVLCQMATWIICPYLDFVTSFTLKWDSYYFRLDFIMDANIMNPDQLWESVIVLCFVVRYFMSILILQSS